MVKLLWDLLSFHILQHILSQRTQSGHKQDQGCNEEPLCLNHNSETNCPVCASVELHCSSGQLISGWQSMSAELATADISQES